jgi:hypothetical protein
MSRALFEERYRINDQGNLLPKNHKLHVQARTGPINERQWLSYYRTNPEILAEENYSKLQHGLGFPEIQGRYAEKMRVPSSRFETEFFHTQTRARKWFRQDNTADHLPVFTMGSTWYRDANEALYWLNGKGRHLYNGNRIYNQ